MYRNSIVAHLGKHKAVGALRYDGQLKIIELELRL